MLDEWWNSLSVKERKEIEELDASDDEDENEDGEEGESEDPDAWMKAKKGDKSVRDTSREFALAGVWKTYSNHAEAVRCGPFRGPEWDLRKWTKKDKKPFLFDKGDEGDI